MSNGTTSGPHGLVLNDKPLFPATHSASGILEHKLDDGTVIQATVDGSNIVGYKAYDSSGKALQVRRLRITDGGPPELTPDYPGTGPMTCYYCICNPYPNCQCWPEPCPVA